MRRLREAVKNVKESTLTKLVHDLPAKMNEVYRVKGKKVPPSFDPNKSPFACKCKICEEVRADGYWRLCDQIPLNKKKKQKKTNTKVLQDWYLD